MQSHSPRNAAARCVRRSWRGRTCGPLRSIHRLPLRRIPFATLAFAFALAPSAPSASAPAEGLGLQAALAKALAHNKQLAAFEHRFDEQAGRVRQAGLLPNPKVDLLFENLGGSGVVEGFDAAEATLSLAWAIEPFLRSRRVGVANAHTERVELDGRILRLDVAAETAQRFLAGLESQAHLKATEESLALAEHTVAVVERRVRAGRAPTAELMRARAELAVARLSRDDLTHEQSVAYLRLSAQWGETTPSFSRVVGDLLALPAVVPFDELAERVERNPEIVRLASDERIAEARLRLAEARRWPTLTPSLGVRRYELTQDWSLVAGLSAPIPIFDRNQGRVAESRAALSRARAEIEAERVDVRATLFELHEELQHSIHRAEMLRDEVIPRFEEAVSEARRGYEKGRYPYAELRTAREDLLVAKRTLVEASTASHRLVVSLERLTGERVAK
jgi:cobalt-zinc-cadmium efflux system outer membrane protein